MDINPLLDAGALVSMACSQKPPADAACLYHGFLMDRCSGPESLVCAVAGPRASRRRFWHSLSNLGLLVAVVGFGNK